MVRHRNNIGLMRLIFAGLVIVGHAPELIDGDRHREPLTLLFHTLSLGEVCVDAFFLLSGYLITMSLMKTHSLLSYLERRVLRIFPAYVVAFVLTVFVAGPWVGLQAWRQLPQTLGDMLLLHEPRIYPGSLIGLPYRTIDGAMWTIPIEFRCYLVIALMGAVGLLAKKRTVALISAVLLIGMILTTFDIVQRQFVRIVMNPWVKMLVAPNPIRAFQLLAVFMAGSTVYLWRDQLMPRLAGQRAVAAIAMAALLMFNPHMAEAGLTVFGGLALFWLSLKANLGPLENINNRWDISYGTYLYGWPIATLLLYFNRAIAPPTLAALCLPLGLMTGAASWFLVERWTKDLLKSRSQPLAVSIRAAADKPNGLS